jgi:hypothetical protein
MPRDYYSSLVRSIQRCACEFPEDRISLYVTARNELLHFLEGQSINGAVREQELRAFEAAVDKIEFESVHPSEIVNAGSSIEILRPVSSRCDGLIRLKRSARLSRAGIFGLLTTAAIIVLSSTYLIVAWRLPEVSVASKPRSEVRLSDSSGSLVWPRPATYGVYALTENHLLDLSPLATKFPKHVIPPPILVDLTKITRLATGRAQFVIFKVDMEKNAPVEALVRLMTPTMPPSSPEQIQYWAVSNIAYEMKVSPVEGNAAMMLAQPKIVDFVFPSGRYVLVIKSTGYAFTIQSTSGTLQN